jgi:hypothetical protein
MNLSERIEDKELFSIQYTELYILHKQLNIYILCDYYNLYNKYIYLFKNNNYIKLNINLIECYLYNDTTKIKFFYYNNIFHLFQYYNKETFYLKIVKKDSINLSINSENKELLSTMDDDLYILIKENINININIYKSFNNIKNNNILELYNQILNSDNKLKKNNKKIYSIETFLNRYKYNIYDNEENIINWYCNNLNNKNIFSKLNNIEYCFIPESFNVKDKNLYIINLEDNNYLDNIVDNISKISNIILIYNIDKLNNLNVFNYILFLKNYFKHIIIVKVKTTNEYNSKYNLIKDRFNSIDNTFFKNIERIIYVIHNLKNFDNIILNLNNYNLNDIFLINMNKYYYESSMNLFKEHKKLISLANVKGISINLLELSEDKEIFSEKQCLKENTLFSGTVEKENTMNLSECSEDKELFSGTVEKENTLFSGTVTKENTIIDDYLINYSLYDIILIIIFNHISNSKLLNNSFICNINKLRYIL